MESLIPNIIVFFIFSKIFPGVAKLLGDDEVGITGMVGIGGEDILGLSPVKMKGKAVEDWLPQLIHSMKESYWKEIKKAVYRYGCNKRMMWVYSAAVIICISSDFVME